MGRIRRVGIGAAVALCATLGIIGAAYGDPAPAAKVAMRDDFNGEPNHYQPGDVTIVAGQAVEWTNEGNRDHTVTSDTAGQFDSNPGDASPPNTVGPRQTVAFTFNAPGDYPYHCKIHAEMHGVVHVSAPPQPTTTTSAAPTTTTTVPAVTPSTQPPATTTTAPNVTPALKAPAVTAIRPTTTTTADTGAAIDSTTTSTSTPQVAIRQSNSSGREIALPLTAGGGTVALAGVGWVWWRNRDQIPPLGP